MPKLTLPNGRRLYLPYGGYDPTRTPDKSGLSVGQQAEAIENPYLSRKKRKHPYLESFLPTRRDTR